MKQTYSISPLCATLRNLIGGGKTLNISVLRNSFRTFPSFLIVLFGICLFSFSLFSCEKELTHYPEIVAYHAESKTLDVATSDSIGKFNVKVKAFVASHPDATQDPLYPEIQKNIKANLLRLSITIDDEWDGETTIHY